VSYLVEESSREQMAAEDPFGGSGTFLPFPGLGMAEISNALTERGLGAVPSFAWDGIGAWVEVAGAGDA
jgi:hypothetical protein